MVQVWKSDAIQTPSSLPDPVNLVKHLYTQRNSLERCEGIGDSAS